MSRVQKSVQSEDEILEQGKVGPHMSRVICSKSERKYEGNGAVMYVVGVDAELTKEFRVKKETWSATEHGDSPTYTIRQMSFENAQDRENRLISAEREDTIHFQNGLPDEVGYNGHSVEALLTACMMRLESFEEDTKFGCDENRQAIASIKEAINSLMERTARRIAEKTEGKYEEKTQ